MKFVARAYWKTHEIKKDKIMQSAKITKSVGAVFIDCKKCNPNCPLQQRIQNSPEVVIWKPLDNIQEHIIRTRDQLIGIEKIAENTQDFYNLAHKICYNCTEKQK